ncbi:MAG TPA: ChaN family lipoprotein [Candidatus Kapabacteria bacterium]|nr:ChaN family lipoprotein [Candidatus Kapabacteria bacterium]
MKFLVALFLIAISFSSAFAQYKIFDTQSGKEVSLETMAKQLSKDKFILFGEFHDDSLIHHIQYELFKQIYKYNNNLTLSMEMFERDVQNKVNEYIDGAIDNDSFIKDSRPWPDYAKFYAPMVDFAKEKHLRVLAANIPRKYAAQFVREGFSGIQKIEFPERENIAENITLRDDKYMENFFNIMLSSDTKVNDLPPNEQNTLYLYYGSQVIKDETMAESIVKFSKENPETIIYHLNGDFHSNSFLGTAQKIVERLPEAKPIVITPIYYKDKKEIKFKEEYKDLASYVIFVPSPKRSEEEMDFGSGSHFGENYIVKHNIELEIIPSESKIIGKDNVIFKNPILKIASVDMLNTLKITNVQYSNSDLDFKVEKLNDNYNRIIFNNPSFYARIYGENGIKETNELTIFYEGKVYNKPNETTLIQRHSNSIGIISDKEDEGIYLPGSSFYPKTDKDIADFNCKITLPSEFTLITSFEKGTYAVGNKVTYELISDFPIDDLTLVGGKLKAINQQKDNFDIRIYTYQDLTNPELFFNAINDYHKLYTNLFGNYPFEYFSVVENFFATGFGMPAYTLLSGRLLKMPNVVLSPGSIAHEFVHNWWGNSVFTDYDKGNWCEALTTFSTNYYYNALTNNEQGLINWRKKALVELDALPDNKNYPVKEFKYQSDIFDASIGYQKGAFIFIETMKLLGKDAFFDALKVFASKYKGKRAYWYNLANEFNSKAKETNNPYPIRSIFNQWLSNKELPEYKIISSEIKNNKVNLIIEVKNVIQSKLPIVFIAGDLKNVEYIDIKDSLNKISLNLPENCNEIQIDPNYECLRSVYKWEKPYNFNRTLSNNPIVIIPNKTDADYNVAEKFIAKLKESGYDFKIFEANQVNNEVIKNNSLILLGNFENNYIIKQLQQQIANYVNLDNDKLTIKNKNYPLNTVSSLINIDHPTNDDKLCSVFYYKGLPDEKMLTRYFHYMSYSYLSLEMGNRQGPILSGEILPNIQNKSELRVKIK